MKIIPKIDFDFRIETSWYYRFPEYHASSHIINFTIPFFSCFVSGDVSDVGTSVISNVSSVDLSLLFKVFVSLLMMVELLFFSVASLLD